MGFDMTFGTHPSFRQHGPSFSRRSCRSRLRSEPVDTVRDVAEQVTGDGDLGHLEDDVAPVAHDLRGRNWPILVLVARITHFVSSRSRFYPSHRQLERGCPAALRARL